jgi:hypothetical protein
MPLYGEDEVVRGRSFQGFDDAVGRAARGDAEAVADCIGGLMMRRVYRQYDCLRS